MKSKNKTKKPPRRKEGRPTLYTKKLGDLICEKMQEYASLKQACLKDPALPCERTVIRWVFDGKHPEFCQQYETARKMMVERMQDEILEFSDDRPTITQTVFGSKDQEAQVVSIDSAGIAGNRLSVDSRKFMLTKILPKFKETVDHNVTILDVNALKEAQERAKKRE